MTCTHETVICKCCGQEDTPARLLASRPRKRSIASQEQSRAAGQKGGRPRKIKEEGK